jgi:hypothetical protein
MQVPGVMFVCVCMRAASVCTCVRESVCGWAWVCMCECMHAYVHTCVFVCVRSLAFQLALAMSPIWPTSIGLPPPITFCEFHILFGAGMVHVRFHTEC